MAVFLTRIGVDYSYGGSYAGVYPDVLSVYGAYFVPFPCRQSPVGLEAYTYSSLSRGVWGGLPVHGGVVEATRRFLNGRGWRVRLGGRLVSAETVMPHLDPLSYGGLGVYGANRFEARCLRGLLGEYGEAAVVYLTTLADRRMYAVAILWVEEHVTVRTGAWHGLSDIAAVVDELPLESWVKRLLLHHVHLLRAIGGGSRVEHFFLGRFTWLRRPVALLEWRPGGGWVEGFKGILGRLALRRLGYFHAAMGTRCGRRLGGPTIVTGHSASLLLDRVLDEGL